MDYQYRDKVCSTNVLGYVVAVFAAVATACVLLFFFGISQTTTLSSIPEFFTMAVPIFITTSLFIGITAWPGYILTLWIANRNKIHNAVFYSCMGLLNAILAHVFLALFTGLELAVFGIFIILSLPSGAVGGYAFYRLRVKTVYSNTPHSLHKN